MVEHKRKPDPDEPWRYVCPECRKQVHGDVSSVRYRCPHCKESYKKHELHDKKADATRGVSDD